MASISSFYYQSPQAVFDIIDSQFTLHREPLVELTKAFLDEFKLGLSTYNQAMAMMSAPQFAFTKDTLIHPIVSVLHLLQPFPMAQRQGMLYKILPNAFL